MRLRPSKDENPSSYILPLPLPIPSHKGVVIQARSSSVYNATVPSRDIVRTENYRRRQVQQSQQGFHAVNYRPYQGIGDPFYLNEKKLILHALGQWDESQDFESSSSIDSSDDEDLHQQQQKPQKPVTAANFMLRRTRKDLNTLPKEVAQGRDLVRHVQLGHGLFQMLRKQRQSRSEAKQAELRKKQEQLRSEWQPPKYDSDSSDGETDEELYQDVELQRFGVEGVEAESRPQTAGMELVGPQTPLLLKIPEDAEAGGGDGRILPGHDSRSVAFKDVSLVPEGMPEAQKSVRSTRASSGRSSRSRKHLPPTRPYTPAHSNIGSEYNLWPDKQSLFRQLCALNWLLEAMNIEPPTTMAPISTCWNFKDLGGAKTNVGKHNKDKLESRWKQFVSNQPMKPDHNQSVSSKSSMEQNRKKAQSRWVSVQPPASSVHDIVRYLTPSGKRSSRLSLKTGRRPSGYPRNSIASSLGYSPSGSQSQLSGNIQHGPNVHQVIPEDSEVSTQQESQGHEAEEEALLRYMDECNSTRPSITPATLNPGQDDRPCSVMEEASTRSEISGIQSPPTGQRMSSRRPQETDFGYPSMSAASPRRGTMQARGSAVAEALVNISQQPQGVAASKEASIPHQTSIQILEALLRHEEDPRLAKLVNIQEKRSSNKLRAEANVRPKSSAAVLEYQASLPSNKVSTMPQEMRSRFAEISEEKALLLHDTLEAVERERLRKLRNKFTNMPTTRSLHRALIQMRGATGLTEDDSEKRRQSTIHQQWYIELTNSIPEEIKQDWYFEKILEKLSKYGLVESSKQSTFKFLKVLTTLREWEICSPDVSAAIEFCREKIVEMTIEEYEEFFGQTFPTVTRPETAPVVSKSGGKTGILVAPASAPPTKKPKGKDSSRDNAKSAPAGGRSLKQS